MKELWIELPDYPLYAVSNTGRVANMKYRYDLTPRPNKGGYLRVVLSNGDQSEEVYLHRLVAKYFIPDYRPRSHVTHHNGDKTDCSVGNLRMRGKDSIDVDILDSSDVVTTSRVRIIELDLIFRGARDAARYIGGDYSSVYACLRGERSHHLGYTFEYFEKE